MVTAVVFTTQVNLTSSPGHIPLDGPVNCGRDTPVHCDNWQANILELIFLSSHRTKAIDTMFLLIYDYLDKVAK